MAKADPRKADHWRQHIKSYKASGITRKAYCRKHRLNIHQMDYWRKRLGHNDKAEPSPNDNVFVQVKVSGDSSTDSCIKLRIGQVTVEVAAGFDPNHLKSILQAIGITC